MNLKRIIPFIPLGILIATIGYCLYIVSSTNVMLADKHYFGIAFVVASVVCHLFATPKPRVGKIFTLITLLLGAANIIAFTPTVRAISFGFGLNDVGFDLKFQPFSFLVLMSFLIINRDSIRRFISRLPKKNAGPTQSE